MVEEKKKIVVIVGGGVIQEINNVPVDVVVEVHDYDTDGSEPEREETDADGNNYLKSEWETIVPKDIELDVQDNIKGTTRTMRASKFIRKYMNFKKSGVS